MAFLYILKLRDETHYCGITKNLVKRVLQHQFGESKSTRRKLPVVLKYARSFESMAIARLTEVRIKKQGVSRWLLKNAYCRENIVPMITSDDRAEYKKLFLGKGKSV